jgi:hypothetical protein
MKLLLFFLPLLTLHFLSAAQTPKPIQWTYSLEKKSEKEFRFVARGLMEKGWHVFTAEPGGDGFLIPTSVQLEQTTGLTFPEKLVAKSKVITKKIPEVGVVNFVEGKIEFELPITSTAPLTKLTGVFTYQSCNDMMCLPPVDEPFVVELK